MLHLVCLRWKPYKACSYPDQLVTLPSVSCVEEETWKWFTVGSVWGLAKLMCHVANKVSLTYNGFHVAKHLHAQKNPLHFATLILTSIVVWFQIESRKLDWKVESKCGSLDNAKHKAGGGEKKVRICSHGWPYERKSVGAPVPAGWFFFSCSMWQTLSHKIQHT